MGSKQHLNVLLLAIAMALPGADLTAAEKKRIQLNVKERKRAKNKGKKTAPQLRRSAVFAIHVEKKLSKGIGKTTAYLKKTAAGLPKKSAQRLQILERILNLHMENATYLRSDEERTYDRRWRAWEGRGRRGKEPRLNSRKSNAAWKRVIRESTVILKEYPRARTADVVTFNKAVGLQYIGKEKNAARMYSQLIQKYPNSNVAGDAYASLGDYYFDRNDFRNAKTNYKKATRFKRSKRYIWSMFKMGWCDYNLGQYKAALTRWKQVVREAPHSHKASKHLKEEALRDMVYAFAEVKDVEGAIAYYRAHGGTKYIGPFLNLLATILADQGYYKSAIRVLKRFQKVAPRDPEGPVAQKEIINLYYVTGKMPMVWKELARFAPMYGRRSGWARANKKEVVMETQATIKDQIMYYSTLTHQKAIKDNDRALNKEAKKGYLLYLQSYPKSREVPGVKYLLADIEYYLKNYRAAGRYYLEIASLGKKKALRWNPVTKKFTNIHRESAIDMVRSYVKDFAAEFKVLKKRQPNFKKPKAVSLRAKNYIRACGNYVKWYPKDKKRVKSCDVGIALIYYHNGIKKNAVRYLKIVAKKYPGSKEGNSAVNLLIPLVKDDKRALADTTTFLLKIPAYQKGKIGSLLRGMQRGAEKEAIARESDALKRAKKYQAQAKKYPKDPDVDKLWYNAGVDYAKAGAVGAAVAAYMVVVKRFPKKPQAKDSLLTVARIQEKQMRFSEASGLYLLFARRYPKAKETAPALSKGCEMLVAVNSPKALSVCSSFASRYPDGAINFVERLIVGAQRAKSYKRMADLINKVYFTRFKLSPNQQIIALNRLYDASGGKGAGAGAAARKMIGIFQNAGGNVDGEALRYVGRLAFRRANPAMAKFKAIRLKGGSVDNLAASIQNLAVALQQLEQAYQQVVSTKDAYWGVAALYQMGYASELFADALANPPAIKGAAKADVLKELGPQIAERKKAAFSWYKTAQDTVTRFNIYNDWSVKVINGLARVKDERFVFSDYVVTPDFIGAEVPVNMAASLRGR